MRECPNICSAAVELADVEVRIHRDDGVVRGLQDRALLRLALRPGAIQLVCEIERRGGQKHREPVARPLGDGNHDRGCRGAQHIVRRRRREIGFPDAPCVLAGGQRDGNRDRNRVDEKVRERHSGERNDRARVGARHPAKPQIHLSGSLGRQHEDRDVEERGGRVARLRVERRLRESARGAGDHRRVRRAESATHVDPCETDMFEPLAIGNWT